MAEASSRIAVAEQLPPVTSRLAYYEADLLLLQGRPKEAAAKYREYAEKVAYWTPGGLVIARLREAVAWRAAGKLGVAWALWREGINLARQRGSLAAMFQYVVAFVTVGLLGTAGYWGPRVLASFLYTPYGWGNLLAMRVLPQNEG